MLNINKITIWNKSLFIHFLLEFTSFFFFFTFDSFQLISHQKDCFYIVLSNESSQSSLLFFIIDTLFNELENIFFLSDVIPSVHPYSLDQSSL